MDRQNVCTRYIWKLILTSLAFSIFFGYFVFGPFAQSINRTIGEPIIDSVFSVSKDYLELYFSKVSLPISHKFVYLHVLDSFFALSYTIFLWSLTIYVFAGNLEMFNYLIVLPSIFAGLFDLIENIVIISITFWENLISQLYFVLAFVIPAKFVAFGLALIVIVVGTMMNIIKAIRKNDSF